jgi:phosphoribosylamine--glycine ligase
MYAAAINGYCPHFPFFCFWRIITFGGRVLGVTATGADIAEAQARAYAAVDAIDWPQGFCRRDIGWRAVGSG